MGRPGCRVGWWALAAGGRACQHRPVRSLHPGRGGRTRLPPRELLAARPRLGGSASQAKQPRWLRPPKGRTVFQARVRHRHATVRRHRPQAVAGCRRLPFPFGRPRIHIAVVQAAHPGVVPLLEPGRPRHAHLADIGGRIERCHHYCHLCPLARRAQERGRQARGFGRVEPKPVVFHQEPHHRQSWPPSAADGCDTCRVPGLVKKAEHIEVRSFHADNRATFALAEVK
jgi:hypothetical protein